jgi:hypothetical protein
MITEDVIIRLEYLQKMLSKYAHRWNETKGYLSIRMYRWVDEYDELKEIYPTAWKIYCKRHGWSESHTAFDISA